MRDVTWSVTSDGPSVRIDVDSHGARPALRPRDLEGLTFYTPNPASTTIAIDGRPVKAVRRNGADHTGRASVTVPWTRLEFPTL